MTSSTPISAVIITFNEARNIGRCLDSLQGVVDEVVVVDSFSTDDTERICREKGARFLQNPFAGHIEQKNWALQQAQSFWVLSLDADEALDGHLRDSILAAKRSLQGEAYAMNRLTNYCGQWIRHCGWYPDRKVRLFDRRKGRWGGTNPHDKVVLDAGATVLRLQGDLLHYSYYTVEEHVAKTRRYTEIAAQALRAKGKKGAWWRMWLSPVFKFFRNYILKLGFLDGALGFTICRISAWETHLKYKRLGSLGE